MNKLIQGKIKKQAGNISIIFILSIVLFIFFSLVLNDAARIFSLRLITKNAADAAAFAAAQNLLFFEHNGILDIAKNTAEANQCELVYIEAGYDEITVKVEKLANFMLVDKIGLKNCRVSSVSRVKVIYPWDEKTGLCSRYKFEY